MGRPEGEVPFFLDLEPAFDWGELTRNISRVDSSFLEGVAARHSSGLHVLASPGIPDDEITDSPFAVERMLAMLREEYDHLVLDAEAAADPLGLKILEAADRVYLPFVLSLPCLARAKRLLESFGQANAAYLPKIVLLSSLHNGGDLTPDHAKAILGTRVHASLPLDHNGSLAAINQGRPLAEAAPKSPLNRAVARLAEQSARQARTACKAASGPGRILRLFSSRSAAS